MQDASGSTFGWNTWIQQEQRGQAPQIVAEYTKRKERARTRIIQAREDPYLDASTQCRTRKGFEYKPCNETPRLGRIALPFISCVNFGRSCNLCEPQLSPPWITDNYRLCVLGAKAPPGTRQVPYQGGDEGDCTTLTVQWLLHFLVDLP